jgi:YVTN family beta-propeller protein
VNEQAVQRRRVRPIWMCVCLACVGCQSELGADPGPPARPEVDRIVQPVAAKTVTPEATRESVPPAFESESPPTRVSHMTKLGTARFVIWGALEAGLMPKALATSRDSERLYSSNMGLDGTRTLSVYRTDPLRLERHLDLPGKAIELVVSADDRALYVTDTEGWGQVLVVDTDDLVIRRKIPVPGFPKWMILHPAGNPLYAALWALDGVSRIDLESDEVRTLRANKGQYSRHDKRDKNPRGMALTPDGRTLIVANNADETLSLIDTATLTERSRVRVGYAPRHIVTTRQGRVFVSLTGNDSVLEFDMQREAPVREIAVGGRPKTMVLSHDQRFLYVANFIANSLSVIDLGSLERVDVPLGLHKPSGLAVRADDRFVYVSGFCTHDVWAIERLDDGKHPTLPFGADRVNEPCLDCAQSFEGCPYFPGPSEVREPQSDVDGPKR